MMFRHGIRNTLRVKQSLLPRFISSNVIPAGSVKHVDVIETRLLNLFDNFGASDYIGEPINITEHSVQAMLQAKNGGESAEVQMAALLHDVSGVGVWMFGYPPISLPHFLNTFIPLLFSVFFITVSKYRLGIYWDWKLDTLLRWMVAAQ
jgi:hypothetical protein